MQDDISRKGNELPRGLNFHVPVPLMFITVVTLVVLLLVNAYEIKTTADIERATTDKTELLGIYSTRTNLFSTFSVLLMATFASVAILAYSRYEKRLEGTVDERTRQLRELMRTQEDILDNSPIGIITISPKGNIIYASPGMRTIAGIDSERALLGLNILEMESSKDACLVGYFTMGLGGRAFDVDDVNYVSQTSGKRSVRHYRGVPMKDDKGEVKSLLILIEDVTDKRRAEAEIKWIINGTSTPLFVIDTEHRVRFWNKAIEELTGVRQENVLGTKDQWKAFFDEPKPTLADALMDRDKRGMPQAYENSVPSKLIPNAFEAEGWMMGNVRYLSITAAPIYDPQGEVVAAVETIHDLTDVAISEERYKTMVDNANDLIMILNTKGKVVFTNNRIDAMFGYGIADVIGQDFVSFLHEAERGRFALMIGQASIVTKPVKNIETKALKKDGSEVFVEISVGCIKHGSAITGLQLIVRDTTERKRAERMILQSEENYRSFIDNTHDMIQSVSSDGRLLFVNKAWLETMGYAKEEVEGIRMADIVHPESKGMWGDIFERVKAGEAVHNIELKLITKGGRTVFAEGNANPKLAGGKTESMQWFFHDITKRKDAEEMILTEIDKLLELDQLKDDFIALTAHEMKTPLISILNVPDIMLDDKNLSEKQRESLQAVLSDARKLKTIIDRILTENRLKAGMMSYDFTSCNVPELVADTMRTFERRLKEKGIRFESKIPVQLPSVRADMNLFGEVMTNLVDNAIKFTKGGGTITVGADQDGKMVRVWVRDTGIGIKADAMGKLFEKFYQVEHQDDRTYGGTGLGLHIAREIVEKHGGKIWATSQPNAGTTFYFTLPISDKED